MDRFILLKTFITVTESGNFSKAAELLNQTQSQVSKMIARLEEELGVTLFTRTTRKISLTEEGEAFLSHARAILDRFEAAQEELLGDKAEPKGKIRVLTSDGTGRTVFLDVLKLFLKRYPLLEINHVVSDKFLDLAENRIDVALWIGELKDSAYKARRIGSVRRITVAAPDYLKMRGTPKTPEDLAHHDCICFTRLAEYTGLARNVTWSYADRDGKTHDIEVSGRYSTDNSSIVREAVLAGMGIYQGPNYLFAGHIQTGELVEILKDYSFDPFPIHLVYNAQNFIPTRLRIFMDFFAHEFSINSVVA